MYMFLNVYEHYIISLYYINFTMMIISIIFSLLKKKYYPQVIVRNALVSTTVFIQRF